MNKSWIATATILTFIAVSFAFNFSTADTKAVTPIKWYSLEEAVALQKRNQRKFLLICTQTGVAGANVWMPQRSQIQRFLPI